MKVRPRLVKLRRLRRLLGETRAATAVEYGLIVALVVIATIMAIVSVAEATTGMWNNVNDKVTHAG
ncbi:Flp family type IVb pilin [Sphingomonas sp.]|uniref:Flp family type IVb pilin n=1 Tax=Sphingomonas sp. TaxID=28214 RepID=UPI0035BBCBC8